MRIKGSKSTVENADRQFEILVLYDSIVWARLRPLANQFVVQRKDLKRSKLKSTAGNSTT